MSSRLALTALLIFSTAAVWAQTEQPDEAKQSGSQLRIGSTVTGVLTDRSAVLSDGSPFDLWSIEARPGDTVRVEMQSNAFDTYLLVTDRNGSVIAENDDTESSTNSAVVFVMPRDGVAQVHANAYSPDGRGPYSLRAEAASSENAREPWTGDVVGRIQAGAAQVGRLDRSMPTLSDGTAYAAWEYAGTAGEELVVEMTSRDFDAYLLITDAQNNVIAEDDDGLSGTDARLTVTLSRDGVYRILANSYAPSFGEYRISVRRTEPLEFSSGGDPSDRYALLVGVADYPGQENDLPAVAGDVRRMRDLLVNHFGFSEANIVVLEDDRATRENIVAAFTQHLAKAGGGGTALFYYSGHGTQLPENIALTGVLDPEQDGVDEALYVYDGELLDDEIGVLLDRLPAENIIVIFDSCFSGAGTRDASGKVKEVPFASVAGARPKSYIGAKNGKSSAHWRGFAYQVLQTPTRHVFLAASDEDQLSWIGPESMDGSVFTYYLAEELRRSARTASFEQIMRSVRDRTYRTVLDLYGEEQEPRVEGERATDTVRVLYRR